MLLEKPDNTLKLGLDFSVKCFNYLQIHNVPKISLPTFNKPFSARQPAVHAEASPPQESLRTSLHSSNGISLTHVMLHYIHLPKL